MNTLPMYLDVFRKGLRSLLLMAALVLTPLLAQGQPSLTQPLTQFLLDGWTSADGLPQNTVSSVVQTRDGYLWLGTQEGLVRFDGHQFTVFDKRNSDLPAHDVSALYEDADGVLWIGMRSGGLVAFADDTFTPLTDVGLPASGISAISADAGGALWVGTPNEGLYHRSDSLFNKVALGGHAIEGVNTLYRSDDGALWIGTRTAGAVRLDRGQVHAFDEAQGLPSNDVTAFARDERGTFWIGTRAHGLARVTGTAAAAATDLAVSGVRSLYAQGAVLWIGTPDAGLLRYDGHRLDALTPADGLLHGSVSAVVADREQSLWVATDAGLNRMWNGYFTTYGAAEGLGDGGALPVHVDAALNTWVGTRGNGLARISNGEVKRFTTADGLPSDIVLSLASAPDGALWVGMARGGLARFDGQRFTSLTSHLPATSVYALYTDDDGTLWIGTMAGLVRYDGTTFRTFTTEHGLSSNEITTIHEGPNGAMWIGTYNGGLNLLRNGVIEAVYDTDDGLLDNFVITLYVDDDGVVWFGTRSSVHRLKGTELTTFSLDHGLFSDKVAHLMEDDAERLWMSSNKGLFYVPKAELHAVADGEQPTLTSHVYTTAHGLRTNEFNGGIQPAGWKDHRGHLWFSSPEGVVQLDPALLSYDLPAPPVHVTGLMIDDAARSLAEPIRLKPGKHRLTVQYAALSFVAPEAVRYEYRLEGVDADWVNAGSRREAFYTNLKPGAYQFHVRAYNRDGVVSEQAATVRFSQRPWFYQTFWFRVLLVLVIMGLGAGAYLLRVRQLTVRQRELEETVAERTHGLKLEKDRAETALAEVQRQKAQVQEAKGVIEEQAEQLREMDKMKTRFFNNISHEFRTPLTLNIGPLENALTGAYGEVNDELKQQLEVMLRNSRRLLRLINQLLDLAKLEEGSKQLHLRYGNLLDLIEGTVLSFTPFTLHKDLDLQFHAPYEDLRLYFDPAALEKVLFNLISNAVKFTPAGGEINVSVREKLLKTPEGMQEGVEVRVHDTGEGIPANQLAHIFDRFHQVDGAQSNVQEGTGIGLALAKELVELHGGTIDVESELGDGTTFIIRLPKRESDTGDPRVLLTADESQSGGQVSHGPMLEMAVFDSEMSGESEESIAHDDDRPTILVTDDNIDLRRYMVGCLSADYNVVTARDGMEALEKARALRPNLILSDVMMPRMDGYELCQAVRADDTISMTPFVMLTAKASLDARIEGWDSGADDYLAKPFNAQELLARVRNLLTLREQQHALASNETQLIENSRAKSELLGIAAHDLKNPLSGIREFARVMRSEVDEDSDHAFCLSHIYDAADQMLHTVTQLLESTRLEVGEYDVHNEPLDLRTMAASVVQHNLQLATRKDQRLHINVETSGLYYVFGDEAMLRNVMSNLISNAVKYSPHGKDIWVEVKAGVGGVRFSVRDEGMGIDKEEQKLLFQPFQRLSNQPTGDEPSTGLGLSIVKRIVELHEGQVRCDSAPGEGSTFTVELPVWKGEGRSGSFNAAA